MEWSWSGKDNSAARFSTSPFKVTTLSELIPPLITSQTCQNRKSSLPLTSGLNLEVTLTAAASLDTAGQAEVSMWSQSADTKLEVEDVNEKVRPTFGQNPL